jgi:hypothetical protein
MLRIVLLTAGGLMLAAGVFIVVSMGPRNLIGMLRYDSRREGRLRPGDRAPDITLLSLDGRSPVQLLGGKRERPLVLVFGSFT